MAHHALPIERRFPSDGRATLAPPCGGHGPGKWPPLIVCLPGVVFRPGQGSNSRPKLGRAPRGLTPWATYSERMRKKAHALPTGVAQEGKVPAT